MFRIIGETNIDFIGQRKKAFLFSGLLVVLGLIAFSMILLGKANMGLEFEGGTEVIGNFETHVDVSDLRTAISDGGFTDAVIVEIYQHDVQNVYKINVKDIAVEEGTASENILSIIDNTFKNNTFHRDSEHTIGPAVGATLRNSALKAVIFSIIGLIIYIWFRFDVRSGIAATIAALHDVLAVLGIFWVFNIDISLLVVTALLTLAGYSLTDTVVVFDRIRENLKKFRKKGEFVTTVNHSINEVLSRSLMTSISTLLVIITLLFFGGEVFRQFSFAMLIGISVGTYSSIFVASPVLVEWEAKFPKRFN